MDGVEQIGTKLASFFLKKDENRKFLIISFLGRGAN
jgi:hypothetical protein